MDRAAASAHAKHGVTFRDGIGERRTVLDAHGQPTQELLCIRGELSAVGAAEHVRIERGQLLAGGPASVLQQIKVIQEAIGPGTLDISFQPVGREKSLRAIELFGTKVLPRMHEL